MWNKKRKTISVIIVAVLVIAMVLPMIAGLWGFF